MSPREALLALRDGIDVEQTHCEPVPVSSSWRYVVDKGLEGPKIVCLCGSSRFYKEFQEANYELTMAGFIVLSLGFYPHSDVHHEGVGCTPEQKEELDRLHMRKIELADEVLVLNKDGYIGDSTRREIAHAASLGKVIRYLEPTL